jgi:hypothetical protein
MIREGASDRTIEDAIRRLTKRDESYILFTVRNARLMHEANAVSATVREAKLEFLPERFGHAERTRVLLTLHTGDGEVIEAAVIVPSKGYASVAGVFAAALPDLDAAQLSQRSWGACERYFDSITWCGRVLDVAVRGSEVRWIRAAQSLSETGSSKKRQSLLPLPSRRCGTVLPPSRVTASPCAVPH